MVAFGSVSGLASSVKWVWAASVLLQAALFALLFLRGNFKRLPVLTTYIAANLAQAAYLSFLYSAVDLRSAAFLAWSSEAVTLLLQALAATEAIYLLLRPYRGVWGLTWRTLAIICAILLAYIAKHAAGNYHWALLEADRGYHLIFATVVIVSLLLVRYYSVTIPAAYKLLLAGFCFYSCTMILVNTVFQEILYSRVRDYEPIWQFASVFAFALVQVVWLVAVRNPLPVDQRLVMPSADDELYKRLSPELDARLRGLNDKLVRLWK